jgi:hypothetical protein
MRTPDELAAEIRTWLDQGNVLADEVGALEGTPAPAPDPQPGPTPEPPPDPVLQVPPAKPTGLACVIGPNGRPQLSWDDPGGITEWDVRDELNLAKPVQETVHVPRSVRSALKPGQRRRYTVVARNSAGESQPSEAVDVPPAVTPEPQPDTPSTPTPAPTPTPTTGARYPGDIVGKVVPDPADRDAGQPGHRHHARVRHLLKQVLRADPGRRRRRVPRLARRRHHPEQPNPRSELRECNADGSLAWWPMRTGRHAMTVVGQVNRLTKVRPHVVLHQIHGRNDDTTVWRLEGTSCGSPTGTTPTAYLVTDGLALGTRYTLTTEVGDGKIRYRFNDTVVPFELATPQDDGYFKVGCYLQSNPKSAPGESTDEYAEVVVYNVAVTHA